MARPKRNQQACDELAAHLQMQYVKLPLPKPTWPAMAKEIEGRFSIKVTDETLRQMHHGEKDPLTTNPEFLIAVGLYYGVDSAQLGPSAETRLGNLLALIQNWKKLRGGIDATERVHRAAA